LTLLSGILGLAARRGFSSLQRFPTKIWCCAYFIFYFLLGFIQLQYFYCCDIYYINYYLFVEVTLCAGVSLEKFRRIVNAVNAKEA
jgi:hypothetical protein